MIASAFHLPAKIPVAGFRIVRGKELGITIEESELRKAELSGTTATLKHSTERPRGQNDDRPVSSTRPSTSQQISQAALSFSRQPTYPELLLVANDEPGKPHGMRPARQLETDATDFLDFVKLTPDKPDTIQLFANRYGFLSGARRFLATNPERTIYGEDVADWFHAADFMRMAVEVWKMVRNRDVAGLNQRFRWVESKPGFPLRGLSGSAWCHDRGKKHDLTIISDAGKDDEVTNVATSWLRSEVNGMIETLVAPQLAFDDTRGNVVRLVPKTLKAALWLQFAFAVCGEQEYRECMVCGKPFGIDRHNRVSKRKVYCSGSCRVKASRQNATLKATSRDKRKVNNPSTRKGKV